MKSEKTKSSKKKKLIIALSVIPSIVVLYFVVCLGLFFFEPAHIYGIPELKNDAMFEEYSMFSREKNDKLYVKQITADMVKLMPKTDEMYLDNTIVAIAEDGVSYDEMTKTVDKYGASVCGYIECAGLYQIEYKGESLEYSELNEKCEEIGNDGNIKTAVIDHIYYFNGYGDGATVGINNTYELYNDPDSRDAELKYAAITSKAVLNSINISTAWEYSDRFSEINVGVLEDSVADYTVSELDIVNSDQIPADSLSTDYEPLITHATMVAGVIGAKHDNIGIDGACPTANLCSYPTNLKTLSFELAAICKMIHYDNVKVINMSYGYDAYLIFSAALGDEKAIDFINKETAVAECVIQHLIDSGNEFVICLAAGNAGGNDIDSHLYRDFSGYFKYGNKPILQKIDIFGLLSGTKNSSNAKYSYWLQGIETPAVKDRIIVAGSAEPQPSEGPAEDEENIDECKKLGRVADYSTAGERVDILAPGTTYSSIRNDAYLVKDGTSFASPFVASTAAMLFALDDSLTGAEVKNILISTSTMELTDNRDFTYPVLNAGEAVKAVAERK